MNVLSLFAGIGGLELGLERAGMTVVGQVEINPFCRQVLAKHWPDTPRHDDVRTTVQWWESEERPTVDLICGGFPCQDISKAGKRAGLDGDRSGLYFEMHRIVCELRPRLWVMENVPAITHRGLDVVLRTMAQAGYDARWGCLRVSYLGAPYQRERWFCAGWLAKSQRIGSQLWAKCGKPRPEKRAPEKEIQERQRLRSLSLSRSGAAFKPSRQAKPRLGGSPARVSSWVDIVDPRWVAPPGPAYAWEPSRVHEPMPKDWQRLKALGNAVVPAQAAVIGRWIATELLQPA